MIEKEDHGFLEVLKSLGAGKYREPKYKDLINLKQLMNEIDIDVKKLIETFRFLLKYRILFKGTGIEFAGLREYVPGQDDAIRIDWKASLRSKTLYVKQYEEERDLDVYVLVDASSSMLFGTQNKLKSEYAAVIAGAVTFAGIDTGDNVGFGMFNNGMKVSLEPTKDTSQYYKVLKMLVNPMFYGGICDLNSALLYLLNTLSDRSILFIISDFIGIGEEWKDALKMVCGKLDRVLGIMVRDIRDEKLPKGTGYIRVAEPFTGKVKSVDLDKVRIRFERLAKEQEQMVINEFQSSKAGIFKVYTTEPFVKQLIKYIELSEVY